jgi:hypothetical protein
MMAAPRLAGGVTVYGGPAIDVIQLAQQLEKLRYQGSTEHSTSGFGFLANLADNLQRASQIIHDALPGRDAAGDTASDKAIIGETRHG